MVEVLADNKGFNFFNIPDSEFRRKILDGGPLTVARVPLVLQQWQPRLKLKKDSHSLVHVWIRLKNLPFALWSAMGISTMASAVGKLLYVDIRTEQMKMISFVRVCVEILVTQPRCNSVDIDLDGESCSVEIEYK